MIAEHQVRTAIEEYLARNPQDRHALAAVTALLDQGADLTRRTSFPVHATVGALLLDTDGFVLTIVHKAYGLILQPGGHLEPDDDSLIGAALRELSEECGIDPSLVTVVSEVPAYIEYGPVPARPEISEPAHRHLDFGFLLTTEGQRPATTAQVEEVASLAWRRIEGIDQVLPAAVARALTAHASRRS